MNTTNPVIEKPATDITEPEPAPAARFCSSCDVLIRPDGTCGCS